MRASSIFRKLDTPPDFSRLSADTLAAALSSPTGQEYWQLALLASQADAVAEQALATSEPAVVAKFAFQLAQSFNNFYHRHPILREPDPGKKLFCCGWPASSAVSSSAPWICWALKSPK